MIDTPQILRMLSSRSVMQRKAAITMLRRSPGSGGYLAVLSLRYMAEHDPCYTVRNTARQALYSYNVVPEDGIVWDKSYSFGGNRD
jgi:hypothetical protein